MTKSRNYDILYRLWGYCKKVFTDILFLLKIDHIFYKIKDMKNNASASS